MNDEKLDRSNDLQDAALPAASPEVQLPAELLERFEGLVAAEKADGALALLESLDIPELTKQQARIQILNRSGDHRAAAAAIRDLVAQVRVPPAVATRLAAVCLLGADIETCSALLDQCIEQVPTEDGLVAALQMGVALDNDDLVSRARAQLVLRSSTNPVLDEESEARLLRACSQSAAEALARPVSREGFEAYQHFLADQFTPDIEVDHEQVVRTFIDMWPARADIAWMCAATHAEASDIPADAMNSAMELIPRSRYSGAAAGIVARALQTLLISDALDGDERIAYQHPLQALVTHLAAHPADAKLRAEVIRTVSVETAGPFGEQLLGSLAYSLHHEAPRQRPERARPQPASEDQVEAFLSRFGRWGGQRFVLDPTQPIPAEIIGEDAAGLVSALRKSLERELAQQRHAVDLAELDFQAHLLPPMARHVSGSADDIHALRILAAQHALRGSFQRARDLAELVLKVAGDAPERRRLAWGVYADVYQRSNSLPDALLGLACAASTDADLPPSDLYQESYLLFRLARSQGLPSAASFLERTRQFQQICDPREHAELRLDVAELGLRQASVDRNDREGLASLLEDCQRVLARAIQLNDVLDPPAFLCAQTAGLVERSGGKRPAEAWDLIDRAAQALGPEASAYLRSLSSAVPAIEDLIATHNLTSNARFAADATTDAVGVTMAARRFLLPEQLAPEAAFLGCELLADRGLTIAGARTPLTKEWPLQFAQSVAQECAAAVLMLALDDHGELCAAVMRDRVPQVLRPARQERSFHERIETWSRNYPYAYGVIEPRKLVLDERTLLEKEVGDSEFYDSMRPFAVPLPDAGRVILIAEPEVAQLPFNLVLRGRELAGYEVAFGIVPSLTWLRAVRERPRSRDTRRLAWISEGRDDSPNIGPIEVVRNMIGPALERHDVTLNASEAIPLDMRGAQMAIIGAHGQLMPDKKYFHRIADDGALQESSMELARALQDVELAILLVCSGGRLDRHPAKSTTVGLPTLLLNNGCRTVIASPWPLESVVPGTWLPAFLEHWESGATAMDACHRANLEVSRRRDREPQASLAMTVYGDPLLAHAA